MAQKRILVADDSEDIRDFFRLLLENEGYQIVCVEDGQAALEEARRARPDLVITDVSMPRMTGLELLVQLRSDLAPPLPPAIVISGFDQVEANALSRGAVCFVPKPIEPSAFLETVAQILGERPLAAPALADESRFAHEARRRAAEKAAALLARLQVGAPDFDLVASRFAQWVADYFAITPVAVAMVDGQRLRIAATSAGCLVPAHATFSGDLLFSTGVLAAGSSLLVPDATALAAVSDRRAAELGIGFLVAVPLVFDEVPIGALALVGGEPRPFDAADLLILEGLGRHATSRRGRFGENLGWLEPPLFDRVLTEELTLMHRDRGALELVIADVASDPAPAMGLELAGRGGARFGLCRAGAGTLLLLKRDRDARAAARCMSAVLAEVEVKAAGWVSVIDDKLPRVPREAVLRLAERAIDDARADPSARVQRFVLGSQAAPALEPAAAP